MEKSIELIYYENNESFKFSDNDILYSRKSVCPRYNIDLRKIYKYMNKLIGKKNNINHITFSENNNRYSIDIIRKEHD